MVLLVLVIVTLGVMPAAWAQDPFPAPIAADRAVLTVRVRPFATIPGQDGAAPRLMTLVDHAASRRLFVSDMRGPIYTVSHDGRTVRPYVDVSAPEWGVMVQSGGRERGVQGLALHPQFGQRGAPGYGKFYTFTDTSNTRPAADFRPAGGSRTHDTVLLEWTARSPEGATYDGGPPREVVRFEQPFGNHNGGLVAFNPTAAPGTPDYGLLYVANADGGSGGDPLDMAENLGSAFGKLLRIDPLGTNSRNGKYGVPADNPFVAKPRPGALGEIYAYGIRNGQRFAWDSKTGNLFLADIGQNQIEEVDLVRAGANLGWNTWEGSYRFAGGRIERASPRSDPQVTYPVVEYGHGDSLLQSQVAVTMGGVYRGSAIAALKDLLIFGDNPSGEIFSVNADSLPQGGQDAIRRILLSEGSGPGQTLLALIQAENARQGTRGASRADLRFGVGAGDQIFLLNKADGVLRVLTP
ncbi:MAG: sorbosone dehydrogenase family protein [Vicinamibacterales bacterium]